MRIPCNIISRLSSQTARRPGTGVTPVTCFANCEPQCGVNQYSRWCLRQINRHIYVTATEPNFRKSLSKCRILSAKTVICQFSPRKQLTVAAAGSTGSDDVLPRPLTPVDACPRPIAHKSTTNIRSIAKIGRSYGSPGQWYIAHQFQGRTSRLQTHIVRTSRLCLFLILETKCCTYVIRGRWGHTVSAEPGGHTSCLL